MVLNIGWIDPCMSFHICAPVSPTSTLQVTLEQAAAAERATRSYRLNPAQPCKHVGEIDFEGSIMHVAIAEASHLRSCSRRGHNGSQC
jgi:hypothetical protein